MNQSLFKGMGGHQSAHRLSTDWLTPPEIVRALGPFDTDPAASCSQVHAVDQVFPKNPPCAAKSYCKHDSGLGHGWEGRVWLNPPYDDTIGLWMRAMQVHGDGVALVFARTETIWFQQTVFGLDTKVAPATAIKFLKGRITFLKPDGSDSLYSFGAPSVLIAYGHENAERLRKLQMDGAFVELPGRLT